MSEFGIGDLVKLEGKVTWRNFGVLTVVSNGHEYPLKEESVILVEKAKVIEPKLPGQIWRLTNGDRIVILTDNKYMTLWDNEIREMNHSTDHWIRVS